MKLATLDTGGDGRLLIVSRDLTRAARAKAAPTLQAALDDWEKIEPALRREADAVERGATETITVDPLTLAAVLPRAYQFLDASAFLAHNHILARAWGFEPRGLAEPPLMYQGLSDRFYAAHAPVPFRSFDDEVDFEAEYGVITDAVPLGISPDEALHHVRLLIVINDWSLRAFGPGEMRGGFGFLHAKPPSTLSAFAVTPDELGDNWRDGRVQLPLQVKRNGELFGEPLGAGMHFGFGDLIAHAATTRSLCAGTVIGSGTVSNDDADRVGSACIAERRALDTIAGKDLTPYLQADDLVELACHDAGGQAIFGALRQRVVRHP